MVLRVAGPSSCPLGGAKMRDGEVELLEYRQHTPLLEEWMRVVDK